MSRKVSRSVHPGRKLGLTDNRPMPEQADELIPLTYHPFGEKIDTFSLTNLERNLPKTQINSQKAEEYIQDDSYYDRNESGDGSNVWDEYWFPSESESSDLSQSAASFMSWSDEIEEETTKKLQEFYDSLESFLYDEIEAPENVKPELLEECRVWKKRFPHIRVVGTAILPPRDYRTGDDHEITEEILAIDESDSDEETIQGSPSFLSLNEDRFVYDDVTMGTRCETNRSALHAKIKDRVNEEVFDFVTEKLNESRRENRVDDSTLRLESATRLKSQELRIIPSDLRPIASRRSTTAASTKSDRTTTVRLATCSSRLLQLHAPVSAVFEPLESRAYHSAASRVKQQERVQQPARRMHSFGGQGAKCQPVPSRQDTILRELRESRSRLSGNGTGDGNVPERTKTWSGGRNVVLPPLGTRRERISQNGPNVPGSVEMQVRGTSLKRTDTNGTTLSKYTLLGGPKTKVKTEDKKFNRF